MNSLQIELNEINDKLDLLLYRKNQLEEIITEYSDVVNRVKNLIDSMQDANVEPSNLLMEIESLIHCPDLTPEEPELTAEPTPEPTPEPVKLMALVPTAVVTPTPTPEPTPKTQLNERAWRRGDTLLIGFSNKRLLNTWGKWFKEAWSDRIKVDSLDKLEGFDHCLSVLWHCKPEWERLSKLNYSLKPTEQNKQEQQPETPPKVSLEDVKATLKQLHTDGLPAILKGELLAHHFNSLTADELEKYLEKLAEQGLINLGELSIMLKFPEPTADTDNPAFEYEQVDEKTSKIYADGVLLGLAKDCGSHWESPQFKGQTFPNRRDIVNALWELVNKF